MDRVFIKCLLSYRLEYLGIVIYLYEENIDFIVRRFKEREIDMWIKN